MNECKNKKTNQCWETTGYSNQVNDKKIKIVSSRLSRKHGIKIKINVKIETNKIKVSNINFQLNIKNELKTAVHHPELSPLDMMSHQSKQTKKKPILSKLLGKQKMLKFNQI